MNIKIAIGALSNRGFRPATVKSLLELQISHEKQVFIATQGYHIAENRNWLATQAIKADCTHLFFADDDMIFPPDTLVRLLAHDKDVVGVAYHPRFEVEEDKENTHKPLDKTHIITLKEKGADKLFECEAVGTGIMLIKINIFNFLKRPWFAFKNHEIGYTTMGEDWWFCKRVREANFKIWCDPTIKVGHIGEKVY